MLTTSSQSYLHISSDIPYEGQNYIEAHSTFLPTTQFIFEDVFTFGSKNLRGSWSADGGDLAAPPETRERRQLCISGKANLRFFGTSIAIRVAVNPGWGKGQVRIDGVKPSQIAGLTKYEDVLDCEASAHDSWGNDHKDIIVADNLPVGWHNLEIFCVDNNSKGFVVISGAKVYDWSKKSLDIEMYSAPRASMPQPIELTLTCPSPDAAANISVTFDPFLLDATTLSPLGTRTFTKVDQATPQKIMVLPNFTGSEVTGSIKKGLTLSYKKRDSIEGTELIVIDKEVNFDAAEVTRDSWWWQDPPSTWNPEAIVASNTISAVVSFNITGDKCGMRVYVDYGQGSASAYKNLSVKTNITPTTGTNTVTIPNTSGLSVGMRVHTLAFPLGTVITGISGTTVTLSQNATNDTKQKMSFGNYVGGFTSNSIGTSYPERTFQRQYITGLGSNFDGTIYVLPNGGSGAFIWNRVMFTSQALYSSISENLYFDFKMKQVLPAPVLSPRIESGKLVYDPLDKNDFNFLTNPPYDNRIADLAHVEYRFPTFICCYTPGYVELFKQYDIVITDPGALTRKETKELQDLGIQVYMYVSFGEESSVRSNIWDMGSPKGPHPGDGLGPGGYASYYMKGGHNYREQSECAHDRQALEDVKACGVDNPKYYQSAGRCGSACQKDYREGYLAFIDGGKCTGGYTSSNYWKRSASVACSNNSCPQYEPVHLKCPSYTPAEGAWGQDFSIANPDKPDENGVWASYYIEATRRDAGSWYKRLEEYYMPLVFGLPTPEVEQHSNTSHLLTDGVTTVLGIKTDKGAFDEGEPFSLVDELTGFTYIPNVHYSMDKMDGTFIFSKIEVSNLPDFVVPYEGQALLLSYHKRGLGADGVFMDTVDTVDVYPREDYQAGFAGIINDLKALYPSKGFCSNRGFSILDRIIGSCSLVMTESVFSHYNFNDGKYSAVNEASAAYNEEITKSIQELRKSHLFDVVCLNYAPNGPEGDELRASVEKQTLELGWMPWLSTVLLNDPLENRPYRLDKGFIRTNDWRRIKTVNIT